MVKHFWETIALGVMLLQSSPAEAEIVLTVSGHSKISGLREVHEFELAELESLGMKSFITKIPSLPGEHFVSGPLVRDLMSKVDLAGSKAIAVALDNYSVEIPLSDFYSYDVILASKIDGQSLSVRERGPIWIIYPLHQNPELDDPLFDAKSIWQLNTMKIE